MIDQQLFHDAFQRSLAGFMFLLIALRLYIRGYVHRKLGLSDVFVILAWCFYTVPVVMDWWPGPYGLNSDDERKIWARKYVYYWQVGYWTLYYCIKASILLFYNEWIPKVLRKEWMLNRCLMAFTGVCYLYTFMILMFRCLPVWRNWSLGPEHCCAACNRPSYYSRISLHIFTDLLIVLLPIFVLYRMEALPFRQKIGAGVMFALGLTSIATTLTVLGVGNKNLFVTFIAQNIDQSAGIIVACCPAFKVLLSRSFNSWFKRDDPTKSSATATIGSGMSGKRSGGTGITSRSSYATHLDGGLSAVHLNGVELADMGRADPSHIRLHDYDDDDDEIREHPHTETSQRGENYV